MLHLDRMVKDQSLCKLVPILVLSLDYFIKFVKHYAFVPVFTTYVRQPSPEGKPQRTPIPHPTYYGATEDAGADKSLPLSRRRFIRD